MTSQRKYLSLLLFFAALLMLLPNSSRATHLIGGMLGYEDLGPDPNNPNLRTYRVFLQAYMDCNSPVWGTTFPEPTVAVGIYGGVLNPPAPINNDYQLTLLLTDSTWIDPNLPPHCANTLNFLNTACIYLIEYSNTINLPANSIGYHVIYERCCRSNNILNLLLAGDQGFTYNTWIPANPGGFVPNSSPTFNDTLVSYICKGDTGYLPNIATDPDGDSLVYSLEPPFRGYLGNGQGGNPPPSASYSSTFLDPYTLLPPIVTWQPGGYGANSLFGPNGFQYIDPQTGIARFSSQTPGIFVAMVEIKEFRNGQQIGVIRRNIQLIVEDCPPNNAPYHDISSLSSLALNPTTYEVEEGQNFCIDLKYKDPDGDSVTVEASGNVFNAGIVSPTASLNHPPVADDSITAQFCWNTGCGQGRSAPYKFNITVSDVACPPLPLIQEIQIIVNPFEGPVEITGDDFVCSQQDYTYSVPPIAGASYNWMVSGGTVVAGANSPNVTVEWGTGSNGTVSLIATSQHGCPSDQLDFPVDFAVVPVNAGTPNVICPGDSIQIGGVPTTSLLNTVTWTPNYNIDSVNGFNPIVFPEVDTSYIVTVIDTMGCEMKDTVSIAMHPYTPSDLYDDYFICAGDTVQFGTTVGSDFTWRPFVGISNPNVANPFFYGIASRTYYVDYKDLNGCFWTDSTYVNVGAVIPTQAGNDATICPGDTVQIGGNPTAPPLVDIQWNNVVTLNDATIANPIANPLVSTTYIVTTSADTCTGIDTVQVNVHPIPNLGLIDDLIVCKGDSVQLATSGTGTYIWESHSSLDATTGSAVATPNASTTYYVTFTDAFGCENFDSVKIAVQEFPQIDAGEFISGCADEPTQLGGSPTGSNDLIFTWEPTDKMNDSSLANPIVTLDSSAYFILTAVDSIGCVSRDSVFVDIHICDCFVYIPNAFTPDGDGLNDGFKPEFYCEFDFYDFSIFNRWGELVFETTNDEIYWNGWYNNHKAQQGVYVYKLKFKSIFGKMQQKVGQVTLIAK